MRVLTLAVLATALALPAAPLALEAPRDYAGQWSISGVSEGPDVCTVTLTDEGAIGGWAIEVPKDCETMFDLSPDVAAWTVYPNGAIGFIDPLRKQLLKFEPSAIGGYVAERAGAEALSLDRIDENQKELTEEERMSDRWALMSFGETLCAWLSTPTSDGMKGVLARQGDCRAEWRGIVKWQRTKGGILLLDAKGKPVRTLPGDSIEGFFSPQDSQETLGFVRDWN